MRRRGPRLTYANVVATLALFVAVGGGAYAAVELPAHSVGTAQLKQGSVTPGKLAFPLAAAGATELNDRHLYKENGCDAPEPPGENAPTPCPASAPLSGEFGRSHEHTIRLDRPGLLLLSGVAGLRYTGAAGTRARVSAAVGVDERPVAEPVDELEGQSSTEMPLDAIVKVSAGVHRFAVAFSATYSTFLPGETIVDPITLSAVALPQR